MSIANPNRTGVLYYTSDGQDPRPRGGQVSSGARSVEGGALELRLTAPTTIKARIKANDEWSALQEAAF